MSPLSFAITAAISAGALVVNPGAADVLINAVLGIAAVLLVRNAVGDLDTAQVLGMPGTRFRAQLGLLRIPGRRRSSRGVARIVAVYGLVPGEVTGLTPDGRMEERARLEVLLMDMDRIADVRPFRPFLPDSDRLRRALAAQAGAGAPSYAAIYDAACLALEEPDWPKDAAVA